MTNSLTRALIGVDVGNTTTSAGLVTLDGRVLSATQGRTHRDGPGTALDLIRGLVEDMLTRAAGLGCRVEGIGIGLGGPVDTEGGTMRKGVHQIPELAGAPLVEAVRAPAGIPVFVDNDVNALALAEWTWGVGRDASSMVMLALGTGVGGAVILDGHLVRGKSGYGGEFGHVSINFDGPRCICGIRGCLAAYAAGRGIAAGYLRRAPGKGARLATSEEEYSSDAEAVFRAAEAGDADARAVIEEACRALGVAIGSIANGLNPDVIAVTGGVLATLARFEPRILEHAAEYGLPATLADARIHFAAGRKHETVRGGAALVLYEQARRRER